MRWQNIEVEGLDELLKAFDALPVEAIDILSESSKTAANIVLEAARDNIHDVTGDLSKNLKVRPPTAANKRKYRVIARVGFGKDAMHGVPLELGHRIVLRNRKTGRKFAVGTVDEKPFLRPAADDNRQMVQDIMVAGMNRALEEMGGKK